MLDGAEVGRIGRFVFVGPNKTNKPLRINVSSLTMSVFFVGKQQEEYEEVSPGYVRRVGDPNRFTASITDNIMTVSRKGSNPNWDQLLYIEVFENK